jgi:uncharacterized phage-associated protein
MAPPYPTLAVANYFIDKSRRRFARGVGPMKLQKLIYFAHGWHLAITGRPLIDEPVEAWKYGPVIPSVYHEFKSYGREEIDFPAFQLAGLNAEKYVPQIPRDDSETLAILDRVWQLYGRLSGPKLSAMTHQPDTPWAKTWERSQEQGKMRGADIPDSSIEKYFRDIAIRKQQA